MSLCATIIRSSDALCDLVERYASLRDADPLGAARVRKQMVAFAGTVRQANAEARTELAAASALALRDHAHPFKPVDPNCLQPANDHGADLPEQPGPSIA